MAASDLIVGKAGLTSSEVWLRAVMVLVNPIPGQEERNSDDLLEEGAPSVQHLPALARSHPPVGPGAGRRMRQAVRWLAHPNAAADIVSLGSGAIRLSPLPEDGRRRRFLRVSIVPSSAFTGVPPSARSPPPDSLLFRRTARRRRSPPPPMSAISTRSHAYLDRKINQVAPRFDGLFGEEDPHVSEKADPQAEGVERVAGGGGGKRQVPTRPPRAPGPASSKEDPAADHAGTRQEAVIPVPIEPGPRSRTRPRRRIPAGIEHGTRYYADESKTDTPSLPWIVLCVAPGDSRQVPAPVAPCLRGQHLHQPLGDSVLAGPSRLWSDAPAGFGHPFPHETSSCGRIR